MEPIKDVERIDDYYQSKGGGMVVETGVGHGARMFQIGRWGRRDEAEDQVAAGADRPGSPGILVPAALRAGAGHRCAALIALVGSSLLQAVGHPELIAKNKQDYIRSAVDLAQDIDRLIQLRESLAAEAMASPLCDVQNFTVSLEKAYRDCWTNSTR